MLLDLSHVVENGLVTYRGLPAPVICDYLSREESRSHYSDGTTFQIARIDMVSNTGTYIDAPFHRYVDGEDISQLNLEKLSNVEGVLIPIPSNATAIDESFFLNVEVTEKAVLIRTGWSRHWKTEQYFEGHPYLTERAAAVLRDKGARIVGIDSYNIDDIMDGKRPVHSVLLRSGIPIVEHLCNLEQLPDRPFAFSAIPAKIKGCGTFPVRAYAAYASKAQS